MVGPVKGQEEPPQQNPQGRTILRKTGCLAEANTFSRVVLKIKAASEGKRGNEETSRCRR